MFLSDRKHTDSCEHHSPCTICRFTVHNIKHLDDEDSESTFHSCPTKWKQHHSSLTHIRKFWQWGFRGKNAQHGSCVGGTWKHSSWKLTEIFYENNFTSWCFFHYGNMHLEILFQSYKLAAAHAIICTKCSGSSSFRDFVLHMCNIKPDKQPIPISVNVALS